MNECSCGKGHFKKVCKMTNIFGGSPLVKLDYVLIPFQTSTQIELIQLMCSIDKNEKKTKSPLVKPCFCFMSTLLKDASNFTQEPSQIKISGFMENGDCC